MSFDKTRNNQKDNKDKKKDINSPTMYLNFSF